MLITNTMPLVVGLAPGRARSLQASTCGRMGDLLGLSADQLLDRVGWTNLIAQPIERLTPTLRAALHEAATDISYQAMREHRPAVILLGREVAAAFGMSGYTSLEDETIDDVRFLTIPHPSGRNRWYNDPVNRTQATAFLRQVLS